MAIDITNLIAPLAIGGFTGFLIVFLVLKNFPMRVKIKIAIGGFLSALVVAALYFVSQNIVVGVILGVSWAFACLYYTAEYSSKNMPDVDFAQNPLQIAPVNAASLSALMLAVIVFILGAASNFFKNPSDKLSLVAFAAPPLLGAISFVICTYFATKYGLSRDMESKQHYVKRALMWWDIGQTILIATMASITLFVALMIDKIIA